MWGGFTCELVNTLPSRLDLNQLFLLHTWRKTPILHQVHCIPTSNFQQSLSGYLV